MNQNTLSVEFERQAAEYLDRNEIYDFLKGLVVELCQKKPEDPLQFLIEEIQAMQEGPARRRVVLLGPPGVARSEASSQLASSLGADHIHVGQLLKDKGVAEEGKVPSDDLATDLKICEAVKEEVEKREKARKGWVLDGFPRTPVQARYLQQFDCTPDRIITLRVEPPKDRSSLPPSARQYFRHEEATLRLFEASRRDISLNEGTKGLMEAMQKILSVRPLSNAPTRPRRIAITGPPCSGKTTQAAEIARIYGLPHIDVSHLINDELRRKGEEDTTKPVLAEEFPESSLCSSLRARLLQEDCQMKGWVLDGFPFNSRQATFLSDIHECPSRIVVLQIQEEEAKERAGGRKVDPETGLVYGAGSSPSPAISSRLVSSPNDDPSLVSSRYSYYSKNCGEIVDDRAWKERTLMVPASGDPIGVGERIQGFIDEPLLGK